jgi:hypothetical protein
MDPNPDKECENRGDIVLLSEIIADSIYWQALHAKILSVIQPHHIGYPTN